MVFITLCKEGNYDLLNENYREILSRNSALLLRYFLIKKKRRRTVQETRFTSLLLSFKRSVSKNNDDSSNSEELREHTALRLVLNGGRSSRAVNSQLLKAFKMECLSHLISSDLLSWVFGYLERVPSWPPRE